MSLAAFFIVGRFLHLYACTIKLVSLIFAILLSKTDVGPTSHCILNVVFVLFFNLVIIIYY